MDDSFRNIIVDWPYDSFRNIIINWPGGTKGFAADAGIDTVHASSWRGRGFIPSYCWARLTEKARSRGLTPVTLELLARLEAQRHGHPAA